MHPSLGRETRTFLCEGCNRVKRVSVNLHFTSGLGARAQAGGPGGISLKHAHKLGSVLPGIMATFIDLNNILMIIIFVMWHSTVWRAHSHASFYVLLATATL